MADVMEVLRREMDFADAECVRPLLKALRRVNEPGSLTIVLIDSDRRLVDLFVVMDGAAQTVYVVEMFVEAEMPDVAAMLLVTDRTGEVPADRPDDALVWEELSSLADLHGVTLLDWIVVWGTTTFSVAEFARVPAQW